MLSPSWLGDVLAAIVLATAAYCAGRLAAALLGHGRVEYDADVTHILMGVGMAGMFVAKLSFLNAAVWEVVFAVIAVWYAVRIARETRAESNPWCGLRHHIGHLVSAGAMLYMFFAMPATTGDTAPTSGGSGGMDMSGGGLGASQPTVALLFALVLFAYAVLVADRIPLSASAVAVGAGAGGTASIAGLPGAPATGRPLLAPRASALCEVVMSVAMGVMLIAML